MLYASQLQVCADITQQDLQRLHHLASQAVHRYSSLTYARLTYDWQEHPVSCELESLILVER